MHIRFIGSMAAMALLATSCASQHVPVAKSAPTRAIPPPEISMELPLEQPDEAKPRFCQLGTSCRSLDTRPFAACLLSTQHCDRTAEPMLADEHRDSGSDEPAPTR